MNPVNIYRRYRKRQDSEQKRITVTINEPKMRIRGRYIQLNNRLKFYGFLGIPYAIPPLGHLRFAPPQPLPRKWYHRRHPLHEAYKMPEICLQQLLGSEVGLTGSEDCLYLSVFIPMRPEEALEPFPVLVYIHGGGFMHGSSNGIDPSFFVSIEKCLVVNVNYRLGFLGFLNMRSDKCCGNAGLKDQVMALKWIRDNIASFGGNPHNVTIFGNDTGGTCVNLHMISPLSKGLFHKAIVSSGGIYCPYGCGAHANPELRLFNKNGHIVEKELRYVLGESLKAVPAKDLLMLSSKITNHTIQLKEDGMNVMNGPSVEYFKEGAFLPDTTENLMLVAEPVPTMAGITEQEGYRFYRTTEGSPFSWAMNKEMFIKFLKSHLRGWSDRSIRGLSKILRSDYSIGGYLSDVKNYARLIADMCFRRFYDNFKIGNLSNTEPPALFIYEFDFFSEEITLRRPDKFTEPFGVFDPVEMKVDPFPVFNWKWIPSARNAAVITQFLTVCVMAIALLEASRIINHPSHLRLTPSERAETGDDLAYVLGAFHVITAVTRISDREKRDKAFQQAVKVMLNMCGSWASFCRDGEKGLIRHKGWRQHTEEDPYYSRTGETSRLHSGRLREISSMELLYNLQREPESYIRFADVSSPKFARTFDLVQ